MILISILLTLYIYIYGGILCVCSFSEDGLWQTKRAAAAHLLTSIRCCKPPVTPTRPPFISVLFLNTTCKRNTQGGGVTCDCSARLPVQRARCDHRKGDRRPQWYMCSQPTRQTSHEQLINMIPLPSVSLD